MEVSGWHGLMDAHAGFRRGYLAGAARDAPGVPCQTRVIDSLPTGEAHRDALLPPPLTGAAGHPELCRSRRCWTRGCPPRGPTLPRLCARLGG